MISNMALLRMGRDFVFPTSNDEAESSETLPKMEVVDCTDDAEIELFQFADNISTHEGPEGRPAHFSGSDFTGMPKNLKFETSKTSSRRCNACAGRLGDIQHLCKMVYQDCDNCYESYNLNLRHVWQIRGSNLVFRKEETYSQFVLELTFHHYHDAFLTFTDTYAESRAQWWPRNQWQPKIHHHHVAVTLHGLGRTSILATLSWTKSGSCFASMRATHSAADSPWSETNAGPPPYMLPTTPLRQVCALYVAVNGRGRNESPEVRR